MIDRCWVFGLWWAAVALPTSTLSGQRPTTGERSQIGLVLSGGSAKGFAHIGVLRALEERGVPIDMIGGTSMGAMVGGLYALGYSARALEDIAREQDWDWIFRDRVRRGDLVPEQKLLDGRHALTLPLRGGLPRLPANIVQGQNLGQLLARLTWSAHGARDFRDLPVPFVALATDVETGEGVPLTSGFLTEAIAASMAIPGLFSPIKIDGRSLVDGLLVRNLPVQDVVALGADVVICSDVTAPLEPADSLRTVIDVLSQLLSYPGQQAVREERERCDVLIEPETGGLTAGDFDRIDEWLARGERAVERFDSRLRALTAPDPSRVRPAARPVRDSVWVETLTFPAMEPLQAQYLERLIDLRVPLWVDADDLDRRISRVFATGTFGRIDYHLDRVAAGAYRLIVHATNPSRHEFGVGIRYDTRYKASLLFTARFDDWLGIGATTDLDFRLGEQLRMGIRQRRRFGPGHALSSDVGGGVERVPLDFFDGTQRVAEALAERGYLMAHAGIGLGTFALVGIEGRLEQVRERLVTFSGDSPGEWRTLGSVSGTLDLDTRDRPAFPRRGILLRGRVLSASTMAGSPATFQQLVARGALHVPIASPVTLRLQGIAGTSRGDELPTHYAFRAGGGNTYYLTPDHDFPFLGWRRQQTAGRHLQIVGASVQVEATPGVVLQLSWNAGEVRDQWEVDPSRYEHGGGIVAALVTPVGSFGGSIGWTDVSDVPVVTFDFGTRF